MDPDVLTMHEPNLRGTDTNSLLRIYDLANRLFNESSSAQGRARADRAIKRIAKELERRNVPL